MLLLCSVQLSCPNLFLTLMLSSHKMKERKKTIPHAMDGAQCLSAYVSEMVMGISACLVASSPKRVKLWGQGSTLSPKKTGHSYTTKLHFQLRFEGMYVCMYFLPDCSFQNILVPATGARCQMVATRG